MVKVYIEQVLEFDEDFILYMINAIREWDDLPGYEKCEDIPTEELEALISEDDELIKDEMYEADYTVKQILVEE